MNSADTIRLNKLLTLVARQEATDLHLTIGSAPVIRKDGALFLLSNEPLVTHDFVERIIDSFIEEDDKHTLEKKYEAIVTHTFNKILRYRIHVYQQKGYYSCSFRYIPPLSSKLADLTLPKYLEEVVRDKRGLVIIAGSHDSGKNTTATAIINTLNAFGPPAFITTFESPIERIFSNNRCIIEQRGVGKDVASYTQGLRLGLKSDVDIVFLDQLNGARAARALLELLEVGKGAIVVMNASTAETALERLFGFLDRREQVVARRVIARHLLCMVSQKLVHKVGGGRVLAYEFVPQHPQIAHLIASGNFEQIKRALVNITERGATTLEMSLGRLVQKGEIRIEEALMEADNKEVLKRFMR